MYEESGDLQERISCFATLRTRYYQDVIFMANITPARIAVNNLVDGSAPCFDSP